MPPQLKDVANQLAIVQGQLDQIVTGGLEGYALRKLSNNDGDYAWQQDADTPVLQYAGNPNTHLHGYKGQLCTDDSTPGLYQNTNGFSAWAAVGGGGSGLPITDDDGTVTASIALTSHSLLTQLTTDAGSVLQSSLELDNLGGIFLWNPDGNGIALEVDNGGGHRGINFDITGSTSGSFVVTDHDGGGISLTSDAVTGTAGSVSLTANGVTGHLATVQLIAGGAGSGAVYLNANEVIFENCLAAPTTADLSNGDFGFWWSDTTHVLSIKAKDSGGTIRTLAIGTLT